MEPDQYVMHVGGGAEGPQAPLVKHIRWAAAEDVGRQHEKQQTKCKHEAAAGWRRQPAVVHPRNRSHPLPYAYGRSIRYYRYPIFGLETFSERGSM